MRWIASVALAIATCSSALAAATWERTVIPAAKGANRLEVDAALLAGAASDLHDLRLVDGRDSEVPYLLLMPVAAEPQWVSARSVPTTATKISSGFEADLGAIRNVDRLRIDGIAAPFMKHVRLEGSGDRARWNLLADTTVFDLPDQKLTAREIAFDAGAYRYLRLTWDDRNSARTVGDAEASARIHAAGTPAEPLRAPLAYRTGAADPRATHYRIALPRAGLPIVAIEIDVAQPDVFRRATVSEPLLEGAEIRQVEVGSGLLRRATREGVVASDLTIRIVPPKGRELLLSIESASGPPLAVTAIRGVYAPQPTIYFESTDGAPITARYGDASLPAPKYDLEAARKFAASAHAQLAQWAAAPPFTVATSADATPLPMPSRGPKIERTAYRFARPIPSASGLVTLPLDAHVLAHTHGGAADVRIVDAESRQIPYVVERRTEPLVVDLRVPARRESKSTSIYRFALPYGTFEGDVNLVLTTRAGVFERTVNVTTGAAEGRQGEPRDLATFPWRNADAAVAAPPLTIGPIPYGTSWVEVKVDEGDNAPLPITSARLLLSGWSVRFHDPGGALTLLYGNRSAEAPRYDLAILAPQLFTQPAREIAAGSVTGKAETGDQIQRKAFWFVIAAAVIILGLLLARLLTNVHEPGGEGS